MKINWRVRIKNPMFWAEVGLAVLVPLAAYLGINLADLTSWKIVGSVFFEAVKNPYVLAIIAVSVYNAVNDPTTAGVGDSRQAMTYDEPKGAGE